MVISSVILDRAEQRAKDPAFANAIAIYRERGESWDQAIRSAIRAWDIAHPLDPTIAAEYAAAPRAPIGSHDATSYPAPSVEVAPQAVPARRSETEAPAPLSSAMRIGPQGKLPGFGAL